MDDDDQKVIISDFCFTNLCVCGVSRRTEIFLGEWLVSLDRLSCQNQGKLALF